MHGNNTDSESVLTARLADFLKKHLVFSKRLQVLGLIAFTVDDDPHEHFLKLEFSSRPCDHHQEDHLSTSADSPADHDFTDETGRRDRRKSRKPQRQLIPVSPISQLEVDASPQLVIDMKKEEQQMCYNNPPVLKPCPTILPSLTPSSDFQLKQTSNNLDNLPNLINGFTLVGQAPVISALVTSLRAPTPLKTIHPAPTGVPVSRRHSTHRNSKVYKCRYCCKTFNRKFCRERHERLHTGVKPYVCTICHETFIRLEDKKRHVRINHPDGSLTIPFSPPSVSINDLL